MLFSGFLSPQTNPTSTPLHSRKGSFGAYALVYTAYALAAVLFLPRLRNRTGFFSHVKELFSGRTSPTYYVSQCNSLYFRSPVPKWIVALLHSCGALSATVWLVCRSDNTKVRTFLLMSIPNTLILRKLQ